MTKVEVKTHRKVTWLLAPLISLVLLTACSAPASVAPTALTPTQESSPTAQEKQLVEAAWDCDEEAVTKLLSDNKLNVDAKNEFGTTALMAVSQGGCADLVELLIKRYGANVNIKNYYGRTALMLADYSSFDTMKILVLNGADVNVRNNYGSTTLMLVAGSYNNYFDVIRLLINNGADVNAEDNEGKTAIDYAQNTATGFEWETLPDKKEAIQLLQKGAQPD